MIALRYRIDDEGVSARWGILWRREVYLTYRRIQDIHVKRNLFERWLGIGTVDIQTASGSSSAELSLEGMEFYASIRDFLYSRMRGARGELVTDATTPGARARGSTYPGGCQVSTLKGREGKPMTRSTLA